MTQENPNYVDKNGLPETRKEPQNVDLEYTSLPTELPALIISIPSGRLDRLSAMVPELINRFRSEQPVSSAMIMITDNGDTSVKDIKTGFQLPPEIETSEVPVFMMTGDTKGAAYEAISQRLPEHIQNDPEAMRVVHHLLVNGGYGPQRVRLEAYLSTLGPGEQIEENGHLRRVNLSLDDDLSTKRGVPSVKPEFAQIHNIPLEVNGAVYLPKADVENGAVSWNPDQEVLRPYFDVLGKTLGETGHEAYHEGRNDQNPALEATQGGTIRTTYREHAADGTAPIEDPNARFLLAFARKWHNPDVEAYSKLLSDVRAGQSIAELPVGAVLTGPSKTIGILTHPVNMDTAHSAKNWADEAANLLPFLVTDPRISDKYGTMSNHENGVSRTNGVRAEMCLLIGENGLLKQITDAFGQCRLAAQVSTVFEHRRLGGAPGIRAPEVVATFSEFLGMELASIVRANMNINTSELSISLNDLNYRAQIVNREIVIGKDGMYDKMLLVLSEIESSILRLQKDKNNPLADQAIRALQHTQFDIRQRLHFEEGPEAFYTAVNEEMKEQYRFQAKVLEVYSHIVRTGAELRREGQFPIAQIKAAGNKTNYLF